MRHAASFARMIGNEALAAECDSLAKEIREGVEKFGHAAHPVYGDIYAYETDGLGHFNLMDDANVPSLLGLPIWASAPWTTRSTSARGSSY